MGNYKSQVNVYNSSRLNELKLYKKEIWLILVFAYSNRSLDHSFSGARARPRQVR